MTIAVVKSGIPRPLANYNEAFVVGDLVFAAGQLASDFKTGVPPEARKKDGFPFYGSDIELQTTYILENLKKTFEAAGSSLDHVVKAQVFLTDLNNFHGFDSVWKRYFKVPPPRTTIGCTGLLVKDTLVEIDLIGYVPSKGRKHEVVTSSIPRPLANYNEAFVVGDLDLRRRPARQRLQDRRSAGGAQEGRLSVLRLGHRAADRVHPGEPEEDLRGRRLLARSRRQGAGLPHRPRRLPRFRPGAGSATSRCRRRARRSAARDCWSRTRWSRSTSSVTCRARGLKHEVVKSAAPRPLAHYNEGFTVGSRVFAAGQIASDYRTGVPPEARKHDGFPFYGSDIELQTTYVLENLKKTFEAAGSSLDQVVKAQVFLTDLEQLPRFRLGVEALLQAAAAAHHHRLHRVAGEGYAGRDRPHRVEGLESLDWRQALLVIPEPLTRLPQHRFCRFDRPPGFAAQIPQDAGDDQSGADETRTHRAARRRATSRSPRSAECA